MQEEIKNKQVAAQVVEQDEELIKMIDGMSKDELCEYAEKSGIKNWKLHKNNPKALKTLLIKAISK